MTGIIHVGIIYFSVHQSEVQRSVINFDKNESLLDSCVWKWSFQLQLLKHRHFRSFFFFLKVGGLQTWFKRNQTFKISILNSVSDSYVLPWANPKTYKCVKPHFCSPQKCTNSKKGDLSVKYLKLKALFSACICILDCWPAWLTQFHFLFLFAVTDINMLSLLSYTD